MLLLVGGALAGAGLFAGVALTLASNSKAGEADHAARLIGERGGENACKKSAFLHPCVSLHEMRETQYGLGNAAVWSFIGAGVVGGATAVYAVIAERRRGKSHVQVTPMVTPHGGAVAVFGTW